MSDSAERLRLARERAGYQTAKDAAEAMGVPVSTYIGHENGSRGYPAKRAAQYARKFKVAEEWLLYGKGGGEADESAEVINLFRHMPADRRREAVEILRLLAKRENAD